MRKVAILDDYLDCALKFADWSRVAGRAELTVFNAAIAPDRLVETLQPFDAVLMMRDRTHFPRGVIERLPNLKFLSYTAGTNLRLDGAAAEERGIVMSATGSPDAMQEHFEFIWAFILATVRNIPANDRGMREGQWQSGYGQRLLGRTIGIIGLGNFGARIAEIANVFRMNVIAWSANLTDERAAQCGARRCATLEELLRESDVVTIHQRLSERSIGLIGREQFAQMKPTAVFINTSRGPMVDEAALIEALREGRILRAGLDVFHTEPLPADSPLRSVPNLVLSPHMGFITEEVFRAFYRQLLENLEAWLDGKPIRLVDAEMAAGRKRPEGWLASTGELLPA